MNPGKITIRVPATTANLGPGFDCIGMALNLWNETTIQLKGNDIRVTINGYGRGIVSEGPNNLIIRTMLDLYQRAGKNAPKGLQIDCYNHIPLGSGLGSSSAAVLTGLFAANVLMGSPYNTKEILGMAVEIEGHPDNAAAAVWGGLVICMKNEAQLISHRLQPAEWHAAVVVPEFNLPTQAARAALPEKVLLKDAVFNLGRFALLVEALQNGDEPLLAFAMQDRLHQPYRLNLIPGAKEALAAAKQAGMTAAALSGAGPGLIALSLGDTACATNAMVKIIEKNGLKAMGFNLTVSPQGIQILD